MATVSAFEAKTHFSELLDRAGRGETITITRYGVPTAQLVPIRESQKLTHAEIVEGMRELRKRIKPDTMSVHEMVLEGRRY